MEIYQRSIFSDMKKRMSSNTEGLNELKATVLRFSGDLIRKHVFQVSPCVYQLQVLPIHNLNPDPKTTSENDILEKGSYQEAEDPHEVMSLLRQEYQNRARKNNWMIQSTSLRITVSAWRSASEDSQRVITLE